MIAVDELPEAVLVAGTDTGVGAMVVTGAAGFIGSHLVDRLLSLGYAVVGFDHRSHRNDDLAALNLSQAIQHDRFRFIEGDLGDADLDTIVKGARCVFHCAAVPGVRPSWGSRFAAYVAANIMGTHRLLAACERAEVPRMVYASSSSVYGNVKWTSRESDPTRPASPYGVTKLAAEQLCLAHAGRADTKLNVVALRYFSVYGPRQRPDMAIGRVLAAAISGVQYTVFGDGEQRRDFTYIDDAIDATVAASRSDLPTCVINVGGGSCVSLVEVIGVARDVVGCPVPLRAVAARAGDVAATSADLSHASMLLGYSPRTELRAGMGRQASWLRRLSPDLLLKFVPPPAAVEELTACSS